MHNSAGETTGIRHCDVFYYRFLCTLTKAGLWLCGARQGRRRKTARNCAWARPKANRARANAARHPCAGMETARHAAVVRAGAHWPQTPRKRRPLYARYLYYIISARPAQASAGTARQNLQRRNRQAEPSAPEPPGRTVLPSPPPRRSKKICLAPLTMPQPHAILIKFPAGKTSYRGVEQMVARRAHNPEVAGSSPVPATTKHVETSVSACFFFCFQMKS